MGILGWATTHWFDLFQTIGVVGSLGFTAHAVRADSRERKVQNLFAITEAHREIWSTLFDQPNLARLLRPRLEGKELTFTDEEELFVNLLILNLAASFRAHKLGLYFREEGLYLDVQAFFSLPIPRLIWEKAREYQEKDFVAFVNSCLEGECKQEIVR